MNELLFDNWKNCSVNKKQELIKNIIEKAALPFIIKETEIFSQNNSTTETVVLENGGIEFVFVPGQNNVVLGWDNTCELGENVKLAFQKDFDEEYESDMENYKDQLEYLQNKLSDDTTQNNNIIKGDELKRVYKEVEKELPEKKTVAELEKYILENTSQIRTVNISPMIVQKDIELFSEDTSYSDFLKSFSNTLFTIPTEDEWEYLCGSGMRTFFRWGDSLEKELLAIYSIGTDNESELLYQPNMFGLNIAYDSYMYELVDSDCWAKGGDGGRSLCGGAGGFYAAPVFSSFFVPKVNKDRELLADYYCYRKIIRL